MKHLTKDETRKLLEVAKSHSTRNWLMILIAYCHGLRVTETVTLTRKQIQDQMITVARLKGSLKTEQPLISSQDPLFDEKTAIEAYLKTLDGDLLFPIKRCRAWQIYQEYGQLAGIAKSKSHPHIAKHSIAMHSIKKAGIENLKQYLGHVNMNSTAAYLRVTDEEASKAVGAAIGL